MKIFKLILILILIWIAFIFLVCGLSISNIWVSFIMAWLTGLLVAFGLFPDLFDKLIKRIEKLKFKFKNSEIEIKSIIKETIMLLDSDLEFDRIREEKGNVNHLNSIIKRTKNNPDKPLVLEVNLSNKITFPKLFVYLFLLDFLNPYVIVFFISSTDKKLNKDNIIGAIQGKKVLNKFYQKFPELLRRINIFDENNSCFLCY